ncbi:MAG: sigma-70 family RNA polymerase sigma factor [Parafilimonas sp.]
MNNIPDNEIINDIKAGNIVAYNVLVNKYKNMVFTLAYNIILNREDAEELSQDVFVKAFKSLSSFKGDAKFSTWLYRIVVNTSLNKKKLKKPVTFLSEPELLLKSETELIYLLKQHETNDIKRFVQAAIHFLKEDERLCITMFYINELSVNEINELTGITVANVKVLLHRGRNNLYHHLKMMLKKELKDII